MEVVPGGAMEVRLLGSVGVWERDREVEPVQPRQRAVLAALAVEAGRPVGVDTLLRRVWGETPPARARDALYVHITRLRRTLGPTIPLPRRSGGYLLDLDPDHVDALRFRSLVKRAECAELPVADRVELFDRALRLWRGTPLADLAGEWAVRTRETWQRLHVDALVGWAGAHVEAGSPEAVIGPLLDLVERHPLMEQPVGVLMRALARSGRSAEALDQYARARTRIADELGVEPGPELRHLHESLLRDGLDRAPRPVPVAPVFQLPPDLPDHTGGEDLLAEAGDGLRHRSPVVVVSGPGGVGKTAFTVRLANLVRADYPDGALFLSLNGALGTPMSPAEVLGRALRALDPTGPDAGFDADLARYRAITHGRRVLVVLDDAAGAEQVRPLLPSGPGCALLVSTRAWLTALPGASRVELRVMGDRDAHRLLERVVGHDRLSAEPEATARLVALCAGLPLALRIVGARLAARPHWPVARLVTRMADRSRRLDELAVDDLRVRTGIDVGYQGLSGDARRALRAVGAVDVGELAPWLLSAALETDATTTDDLLEHLVDARLVEAAAGDGTNPRYRVHDLVRLYATERAHAEELPEESVAMLARVLSAAVHLVRGHDTRRAYLVRHERDTPLSEPPACRGVAIDLAAEEPTLVVLVEVAARRGLVRQAAALADALVFASFAKTNDFAGWERVRDAVAAAATTAGERGVLAGTCYGRAQLRYAQDRFAESADLFDRARTLFLELGDAAGAASAATGLATVHRELGDHTRSIPLLSEHLAEFDRLGLQEGSANAHYGLGYAYRERGLDEQALTHLRAAVDHYRALGHRAGEAIAVRGIGLVHRARGDLTEAARWSDQAHRLAQASGEELLSSYTTQALAKVWIRTGHPERALEPLLRAQGVCAEHGDRLGAALVQRTLGELHLVADRLPEALRELNGALTTWTELDHRLWQARTRRDLGAVHARAGDPATAAEHWRAAAEVFRTLGTREAQEVDEWPRRWPQGARGGVTLQAAATTTTAPAP
ncbi:tetratricopeptide repeat protein [Actinosynnema pretiosum subsp. pretiosum]|uniref:Tetratricopeptide repeat protein n=1 Tax=Actinosynnema pretiosum subsp. pretiosum TaxID=103721 RepID=A0AA45L9P4_9PSEU|nr:tetratricopeptide repeat protein [Actinosynnema pretiosum subsp. pretiosum]